MSTDRPLPHQLLPRLQDFRLCKCSRQLRRLPVSLHSTYVCRLLVLLLGSLRKIRSLKVRSSTNFTMCRTALIDGSQYTAGIITSPVVPGGACRLVVQAPAGKMINIFLTELNMDARDDADK